MEKDWNDKITSQPEYSFLQSWSWGEINKPVFRLGDTQVLLVQSRRGRFLHVPHATKINKKIVDDLIALAKQENCAFIRVSPLSQDVKVYRNLGFRDAPTIMHAEETWLVDISKPENEILAAMRKTTRNLIHRAERENIEIIKSTNNSDIKTLYDLQMETAKRNNFVPFSEKFLEKEFTVFVNNNEALLFLGKFEGKTTAAAIIVFYGKYAFYYQSGSVESKAPVNYLLQWEVIKEAKRRGCIIYNMWGIAPNNDPKHPWAGLTLFKTGFGGYEKKYLHAQDLPLSAKYWLTYVIEKLPKTWRARV